MDFYIARLGMANGFRYKDWFDYSTDPNQQPQENGSTPTDSDVTIGTGDGTTVAFQLIKDYTSGAVTRSRIIRKPVTGTVLVAIDGTPQTEGSDFTVDDTTGTVTFTSAPLSGEVITAGFDFDVPVRFGELPDEVMDGSIDFFSGGSILSIPLVEIIEEVERREEFFYGGSVDHGTSAASVSLTTGQGRVHLCAPTSQKDMILPAAADLPTGGPYFYIVNDATALVRIVNSDLTVLTTVGLDQTAVVMLVLDIAGVVKSWRAVVG